MIISIKTRIWLTVFSIVAVFTLFLMFFFPMQQEKYFLKNYNQEIENLAKTVALGVKIAMTEQNLKACKQLSILRSPTDVCDLLPFCKNNPMAPLHC